MKKTITCIRCPMGCQITVTIDKGTVKEVVGNTCNRGEKYAKTEVVAPIRSVTTTVRVIGGELSVVSVKTKEDIPKEKIMDCIAELQEVKVLAPILTGDVIVKNIANTGVSIVATKDIAVSMI